MTLIAFDLTPGGKIAIHDHSITELRETDGGHCMIVYQTVSRLRVSSKKNTEVNCIVRHPFIEVMNAVNKTLGY